MGMSSQHPARGRLIRRLALIGSVVAVVAVAATATLFYTHRASHAYGAGCSIPAGQKAPTCQFSGRTAVAVFDSIDMSNSGCTDTSAWIFASDGTSRNPGFATNSASSVDVFINKVDCYTGTPSFAYIGHLDNVNLAIDSTLNSATLTAAVPVRDEAQSSLPTYTANISLTWAATGAATPANSHTHDHAGNTITINIVRGDSQPATATGSITVNSLDSGAFDYASLPVVPDLTYLLDAQGVYVSVTH